MEQEPEIRSQKSEEEKKAKKQPKNDNAEHGGRGGLDPVRFGDYEIAGKCVDF